MICFGIHTCMSLTLPCPPCHVHQQVQDYRLHRISKASGGYVFKPESLKDAVRLNELEVFLSCHERPKFDKSKTKQLAGVQHKGGEVEHLKNIYCTGCSDDAPPYVNGMIVCPCPVWHTQIPCRQTIGILERPQFFGRWRQYLAAGCKLQSLIPSGLLLGWTQRNLAPDLLGTFAMWAYIQNISKHFKTMQALIISYNHHCGSDEKLLGIITWPCEPGLGASGLPCGFLQWRSCAAAKATPRASTRGAWPRGRGARNVLQLRC